MRTEEVHSLVDSIDRVEVPAASIDELTGVLDHLNRVHAALSVHRSAVIRRIAELEAASPTAAPVEHVIARTENVSGAEARRQHGRATTLGSAPAFESRRERGDLSDAHTDRLTAAADRLNDDRRAALFERDESLANHAASMTPGQFGRHLDRIVRELSTDDEAIDLSEHQRTLARVSHGLDRTSGMGWVRADLHPDDYQKFKRRLDGDITSLRQNSEHEGLRYDQLAAIAFTGLVDAAPATESAPATVSVLIDLDTLTTGSHEQSVCEYDDGLPVPVATARRHACDAGIIPVVLDGAGRPLDVGRSKRQATSAQRTALRAMYRTCGIDGCETEFSRCEMHHLAEWDRDHGATDLENLVPLCSYHHHRAHEGRWQLQLDPSTRQLTVTLPGGQHHSTSLPDLMTERAPVRAA